MDLNEEMLQNDNVKQKFLSDHEKLLSDYDAIEQAKLLVKMANEQDVSDKLINILKDEYKEKYLKNLENKINVEYVTALSILDESTCLEFLISKITTFSLDKNEKFISKSILNREALLGELEQTVQIFDDTASIVNQISIASDYIKSYKSFLDKNISTTFIYILRQCSEDVTVDLYTAFTTFISLLKSELWKGQRLSLKRNFIDLFEMHIEAYLEKQAMDFKNFSNDKVSNWKYKVERDDIAVQVFLTGSTSKVKYKKNEGKSYLNSFSFRKNTAVETLPVNQMDMQQAFYSERTKGLSLPTSRSETELALLNAQLDDIPNQFSNEIANEVIAQAKKAIDNILPLVKDESALSIKSQTVCEQIYVQLIDSIGKKHVNFGLTKAVEVVRNYDVAKVSKLSSTDLQWPAKPLKKFARLVTIGDIIQTALFDFYDHELLSTGVIDMGDSLGPARRAKRDFEKTLDENVAHGLTAGIDVLMDHINYIYLTEQSSIAFSGSPAAISDASKTARTVISMIDSVSRLLDPTSEKDLIDLYQLEIGTRFFGVLCKHIKHLTISVEGSQNFTVDIRAYSNCIQALGQRRLNRHFQTLESLVTMYSIPGSETTKICSFVVESDQYNDTFTRDEVVELLGCREDWNSIKQRIFRELKSNECLIA